MKKNNPIIAYYGAFISDRIKSKRNLPVLNHACSKRMLRIAQGLGSQARRCVIVSSGMAPRVRTTWRILQSSTERIHDIPVLTIAQWSIKFLGYMLTPITAVLAAARLNRCHPIEIVVQYNYQPDAFLFALWCKFVYRAKVILDLEDVAVPTWRDFRRDSETRIFNELWTCGLMKLSIWIANLVFAPSEKLGCVVRDKNKFIAVTGCQHVDMEIQTSHSDDCVNVLMSGGIHKWDGMDVLSDALHIADKQSLKTKLNLFVCGTGELEKLKRDIGTLSNIAVTYLGFLSNDEFAQMHKDIDVCLALQDPNGRYGQYKAPSKGYETICSGKALVVSDVGDFGLLPEDVCFRLLPYSPEKLAEILSNLTPETVLRKRQAAQAYALEHFECKKVGKRILEILDKVVEDDK